MWCFPNLRCQKQSSSPTFSAYWKEIANKKNDAICDFYTEMPPTKSRVKPWHVIPNAHNFTKNGWYNPSKIGSFSPTNVPLHLDAEVSRARSEAHHGEDRFANARGLPCHCPLAQIYHVGTVSTTHWWWFRGWFIARLTIHHMILVYVHS